MGMLLALDSIPARIDDESTPPQSLLRRVRYASTVSGGGLPVAAYLSLMFTGKNLMCRAQPPATLYDALLSDRTNADSKLALLRKSWIGAFLDKMNPATWSASVANSDLFESDYFVPLTSARCDDGRMQELSLGDAIENDLLTHIPNATVSLNGDVFPFTENHLGAVELQGVLSRSKAHFDWSEIKKSGEPNSLANHVPYATAIAASAAFPPLLADSRLRVQDGDGRPAYLHLTDGGQADDNGTTSALKALENLQNDPASNSPVIYLALDNLPDKGGFLSTSPEPADTLNVLLERNMDLPRYGPKRDLAAQIYADDLQTRGMQLDQIGRLYVAHIGVWRYTDEEHPADSKLNDEKLVKLPTIEAGRRGVTPEQQTAMITAGIMLTYEALFGDAFTEDLHKTVKDEARKVASCLVQQKPASPCSGSNGAWTALSSSASQLAKSTGSTTGPDRGLIEFARKQKINDWASIVEKTNTHLSDVRSQLTRYAETTSEHATNRKRDVLVQIDQANNQAASLANQTFNSYLLDKVIARLKNDLKEVESKQKELDGEIDALRQHNKVHRKLLQALKDDEVDPGECSCGSAFRCSAGDFGQIGTLTPNDSQCNRPKLSKPEYLEDATLLAGVQRKALETFQDFWDALSSSRLAGEQLIARYKSARKEQCAHRKWLDDLAHQSNVLVSAAVRDAYVTQANEPCPPEDRAAPAIPDSQITLELTNIQTSVKLLLEDSGAITQCLGEKRKAVSARFDNIVTSIGEANDVQNKHLNVLQNETLECAVVLQRALAGDSRNRERVSACATTLRRGLALNFEPPRPPDSNVSVGLCGTAMSIDALQARLEKKDSNISKRSGALTPEDEAVLAPYWNAIQPFNEFAQRWDAEATSQDTDILSFDANAATCFTKRRRMTYGGLLVTQNPAIRDCSDLITKGVPPMVATSR
jgi:hypothetical protein